MKPSSTDGYKCKCGRMWTPKSVPGKPGYGYDKICDGCLKKTFLCNCKLLNNENKTN